MEDAQSKPTGPNIWMCYMIDNTVGEVHEIGRNPGVRRDGATSEPDSVWLEARPNPTGVYLSRWRMWTAAFFLQ